MTIGLAERIARSIPGGTFELETFVRLIGVEETTSIETAAVTCQGRSRLRVNPDFVTRHCKRDEHLFLLVMHELWHVLLGHTTAFDRMTPDHNIAFDAIINAGLARQHPQPEYRGFFEELNAADRFPHLLLRPPVGWPEQPSYDGEGWSTGVRGMLRRLYPVPGDRRLPEPTYGELLSLLARHRSELDIGGSGPAARPVLLGGHDAVAEGIPGMLDPLFADVMRDVTASWPSPPCSGGGAPGPWVSQDVRVDPTPAVKAARSAFRGVLRKALVPDRSGDAQCRRVLAPAATGQAPIPTAHDRLVHARRALGAPALLYDQRPPSPVRQPDPPQAALVYLDVSGSMASVLPHLLDLLVPLARRRIVRVQQFSTEVTPLTVTDLVAGQLRSTGGTSIDCVLADAAQWPHRRVLLLTDGYVGDAPPGLLAALVDRGVSFFAGIPDVGSTDRYLPFASVTTLPGLS